MIEVDISGVSELHAKLAKLENIGAICEPPLLQSAYEIRDWVRVYPAKSEANMPRNPGRWYERGRGSMYARVGGGVKVVKRSEMLNRRWSLAHSATPASASVIIGNSASYVRYVHDAETQAGFHKRRGWRTAQDAIAKFQDNLIRRINDAIDKAIAGG